ncbi:MAG: four helix bundle protein [Acidobacteria bacterium]|nr:four helix bundle protein [Acidobacteriota bacterium]
MKKKIECFEDLFIWQKAIEFAKEIYLITEKKGLKNDFGLKGQMRDSAVSISSNIAEGFERRSRKEYLNFLNFAKASAGEIRSQLYIAFEVDYIDRSELEQLREKAKFLSGSITNHMNSVSRSES